MTLILALCIMIAATLAQHLGLLEAIATIVKKVCSCGMCSTFWSCMVVLLYAGEDIVVAASLSIGAAYLSNWFQLLLMWMQDKYDELWQKISKKLK